MPTIAISAAGAVLGAVLVVAGVAIVRWSGGNWPMARRLGGARPMSIGSALHAASSGKLPRRLVRLQGRVRCADPLVTAAGERLAVLHRDLDIGLPGGRWQPLERMRESRQIDLWERGASIVIDPAAAAEPLVVIPRIWRGPPGELSPQAQAAVAAHPGGSEVTEARSVARTISLVDEVLAVGRLGVRPDGTARLLPAGGGLILSNLDLDAAMRLLAGHHPRRVAVGLALVGIGALTLAVGVVTTALAGLAAVR